MVVAKARICKAIHNKIVYLTFIQAIFTLVILVGFVLRNFLAKIFDKVNWIIASYRKIVFRDMWRI